MASDTPTRLKKYDEELQIVWGEVYAPGYPDSQGDFMTDVEIRKMAYDFMAAGRMNKIDHEHQEQETGCVLVESFIARDGDPDFITGAWIAGVHIPDPALWLMVKAGEINGFSFGGVAVRQPGAVVLEIPDLVAGKTDVVNGHSHEFTVRYSGTGEFLGGSTLPAADGHVHEIKQGTLTELAQGHAHRFSFVEGLLDG